ncbi:hypothetical protein ACJ41O_011795 [Fusarium nematophilum]
MSSPRPNLVTLPFELRHQIFCYHFKTDGGYVFDAGSDRLVTADGEPINLSLSYTCRSIAADTKDLPLALNKITFSTVDHPDCRAWAGRFEYLSVFPDMVRADLLLRLGPLITPNSYSVIEQRYPNFVRKLKFQIREELDDLEAERHYEQRGGSVEPEDASSPPDEHGGMRYPRGSILNSRMDGSASCYWGGLQGVTRHYFNGVLPNGHNHCHPLRQAWTAWTETETPSMIAEAAKYSLRVVAEQHQTEFNELVSQMFPESTVLPSDILQLGFKPWAIPSHSDLSKMGDQFGDANIWRHVQAWHHGHWINPGDRSYHPSNYPPTEFLYREKLRFSAAAAAIRFLGRLPPSKRLQLRNVVLHEDHVAVGTPECHARGLIPFCKENPRLRVERRVSLLHNIFQTPALLDFFDLGDFERGTSRRRSELVYSSALRHGVADWLRDALAVVDAGMPADSFTLVLDGEPDVNFCSDMFELAIRWPIACDTAWKACSGRLVHFPPEEKEIPIVNDEALQAMEHLFDQTSVLRRNFHPGLPLDIEMEVEKRRSWTIHQWYNDHNRARSTKFDMTQHLPNWIQLLVEDNYERKPQDASP